jgi:hypothetical protein
MSVLAKKPAPIAAPSAADTFGTTDKQRDGIPVDRRTLRATGRTEQFATRISPEIKKLFGRLAKKAGVTHNALFADMTKLWEQQQGVPEGERNADRNRPLLAYGNDDVIAALELIAEHKKASVSAVIEDMVAERYERLAEAGLVPKARTAAEKRAAVKR